MHVKIYYINVIYAVHDGIYIVLHTNIYIYIYIYIYKMSLLKRNSNTKNSYCVGENKNKQTTNQRIIISPFKHCTCIYANL